jgi:hypothetical protein
MDKKGRSYRFTDEDLIPDRNSQIETCIIEHEETGLLQEYLRGKNLILADRFSRRVKAECGWFGKLVKHKLTIGNFYEGILRNVILEMCPNGVSVGTGFVFDASKGKDSRQIDILIYRDGLRAPICKNGDIVVVTPSMVTAAIEVKKQLHKDYVKDLVSANFTFNFGTLPGELNGVNYFNVFSFKTTVSADDILEEIVCGIDAAIQENKSRLYSIALPRVFFFDRGEFINSRLVSNGQGRFMVELALVKAGQEDNSLGELFSCLFSSADVEENANEPTFLAHALYEDYQWGKPSSIFKLSTKIQMPQLERIFPKDVDRIRQYKKNDQKPVFVVVPKDFDWSEYNTFSRFSQRFGREVKVVVSDEVASWH